MSIICIQEVIRMDGYYEQVLLLAAEKDPIYQELLRNCYLLEEQYNQILAKLPASDRERIEQYISACEELDHRHTDLALHMFAK